MRFPNAQKGVTKLFIAEIFAILTALLVVTAAILGAASNGNAGVAAVAGTLGLVAAFAFIVAFIIQIIGLWQGGKDEIQIKYGLYFTLAAVVFSIAVAVLGVVPQNSGVALAKSITGAAVDIAQIFALIYILSGIATLADKLGDGEMANRGRFLIKVVVVLFVISVLLGLYPNFINESSPDWVKTMVTVTGIVASVVELGAYILIVLYYYRASKMLKK